MVVLLATSVATRADRCFAPLALWLQTASCIMLTLPQFCFEAGTVFGELAVAEVGLFNDGASDTGHSSSTEDRNNDR